MTKDWRGTVITVGASVIYPVRQSSSMWMKEGKVVLLSEQGKIGIKGLDNETERIVYPDPNRITVVRSRS